MKADGKQAGQNMTKTDAQLTPDLSHEVQNALACIQQFGTIILDGLAGNVSEEQRKYLHIMLKNASIIRSVLDSAREPAPLGMCRPMGWKWSPREYWWSKTTHIFNLPTRRDSHRPDIKFNLPAMGRKACAWRSKQRRMLFCSTCSCPTWGRRSSPGPETGSSGSPDSGDRFEQSSPEQ